MLRLLRISNARSVLDGHPIAIYAAKIPFALAAGLFAVIGDPALQLEAEAQLEGEAWLGAFAELVSQHGIDTSEPAAWSLLRRLRDEAQPEAVPLLADAVLGSLTRGRERGEEAFRVWLNGFLASRTEENGGASAPAGRVREALQKALRLGAFLSVETPSETVGAMADNRKEEDDPAPDRLGPLL